MVLVLCGTMMVQSSADKADLKQRIGGNLPMSFEIEKVSEPGLFVFIGTGIDAVVTIPGGHDKVLSLFEDHLRSKGFPVIRSKSSVGFEIGDISVHLTHIAKDAYRYRETFAL